MNAFLLHPVPGTPVSQHFLANRKLYPPFTLRNGQRWPGGHEGLDFAAPLGTPVYAAMSGVVVEVTRLNAIQRASRKLQPPYGNNVRVDGYVGKMKVTTIYAHLDRIAPDIRKGSEVGIGALIGWTGNTGRVLKEPGYHLHFGVNVAGYPVNPEPLIIGGV